MWKESVHVCVQEADGWELALQFSVLVLEGVGGVISCRCLLPRLLFGGAEWTSLLGGLKSVWLGTRAGPAWKKNRGEDNFLTVNPDRKMSTNMRWTDLKSLPHGGIRSSV